MRLNEAPEPVRRIIRAVVEQALARCARLGIPELDFYQALLAEQKLHPTVSVPELYERTFRRLGVTAN